MIFNVWKCLNASCGRENPALNDDTAGIMLVHCKECGGGMNVNRQFFRCDLCSKEFPGAAPKGWYRFSVGAHFCTEQGNWTSGHTQTVEFCGMDCERVWVRRFAETLVDISRKNFQSQNIWNPLWFHSLHKQL